MLSWPCSVQVASNTGGCWQPHSQRWDGGVTRITRGWVSDAAGWWFGDVMFGLPFPCRRRLVHPLAGRSAGYERNRTNVLFRSLERSAMIVKGQRGVSVQWLRSGHGRPARVPTSAVPRYAIAV